MRPDVWKELLEVSQRLTRPAKISGAIPINELEVYLGRFRKCIRKFVRQGQMHHGLKVFVDGKLNQQALTSIAEMPPSESEPLHIWTKQLFGDKKFGMILNNLEQLDNDLTGTVAQGVASLLEQTGIPPQGLALLFFMGDYGFTPFGVHNDNPGEDGFLFHIGPGIKNFYTWERERYLELSGGASLFRHPEKILADATCYELLPGDLMFFPAETYHVAETPEFSVSMVLDFISPPFSVFRKMIVDQIAKEYSAVNRQLSEERYVARIPATFGKETIEQLYSSLNFEELVEEAIEDYLLRLRSNGGFNSNGVLKTEITSTASDSTLYLLPPWKLGYKRRGEEWIDIYARGHRRRFPFHPKLPPLLDRLNAEKGIDISTLRSALAPEWNFADIIALVSHLQNCDAVQVHSEKSRIEE